MRCLGLNIINIDFLSKVLNSRKKLNIITPDFYDLNTSEKLPIIYCLHGLSGNCNDWIVSGNAKQIFNGKKVIAVFPSADNSFYCNMKYGGRYFDYIANEIPEYIAKLFPIDTSKQYIAGLSMGGYGAIKIALSYPERFLKAASFSGVLDIENACKQLNNKDIITELRNCFGHKLQVPNTDNLFYLSQKIQKKLPLYISCGINDFLYEQNTHFVKSNPQLDIRFISEPGEHEWALWTRNLEKFVEDIF